MKPSAVSEVMVEVSQVTWSDIGGLDGLKLRQATGLLQDNESSGQ